jgi:hypothetical protein
MDHADNESSLPQENPELAHLPVAKKMTQKTSKQKRSLEYHAMEAKIALAIADYNSGKYASLAEAGRSVGITHRSGYFRLRARASGRASKADRIVNGSQRLNLERESRLCQFIQELQDTHAIHRQIGEKAYSMLCEGLAADDPLPRPLGKQWPARFLERHPGVMARHVKPSTSSASGNVDDQVTASSPSHEAHTCEMINQDPQLLVDCRKFLNQSTGSDETLGQSPAVDTAPQDPPNVSVVVGGTACIERDMYSPTAPPDRISTASSSTNSFLSAIKSSLVEQKMTFSSRLT